MLEMGGAPSAANDSTTLIRTANASKNSKLQAVAFDFEVLVRDVTSSSPASSHGIDDDAAEEPPFKPSSSSSTSPTMSTLQPNLTKISEVASLLNVKMDMGGGGTASERTPTPSSSQSSSSDFNPLGNDVRSKYAAKLQGMGISGGIQTVEHAKSQAEDGLLRGDAAGHLVARKLAVGHDADGVAGCGSSSKNSGSGSRWMALAGAGRLLAYLTHRSIRIALLPTVSKATTKTNKQGDNDDDDIIRQEEESMRDLAQQLKKDVIIDILVPKEKNQNGATATDIHYLTKQSLKEHVLDTLGMDPKKVLLVTDKEAYLKAGRDLGMLTCRLQPKNARRGNISTHYTVPSVVQVRGVIDEMNGISFNAVLNR